MEITTQEKLMYEVMKSIYDSGMPISFKGSMVLKACLIEAGYTEDIRHTFDIDANWYSDTAPTRVTGRTTHVPAASPAWASSPSWK